MMTVKEIELHVGHFGNGTGARGHIDEVGEARKVTKRVYEILQSMRVPSTFFEDTVSKNRNDNIGRLVKHHNQDRNGLVVSIHFNAGGDGTKPIGTEVLYYDQKGLAERLVKAISDATSGGLKNRGVKQRTDLGVLKNTVEPAVLIEVCFVNSSIDVAIYRRDFEKICQAIANVLAKEVSGVSKPSTQGKYEVVEDADAKVWRIQSGKFASKEDAITAFNKSGLSYATIRGTTK